MDETIIINLIEVFEETDVSLSLNKSFHIPLSNISERFNNDEFIDITMKSDDELSDQ